MSSPEQRILADTTAGHAKQDAVGSRATQQVDEAVDDLSTAAQDAASAAQSRVGGSGLSNTFNDLADRTSAQTGSAVAEGKRDAQTYLDQAKSLAGDAFATAQSYVAAGQQSIAPGGDASGVINTIQSTASAALETTKGYLASAQAAVQPHVDAAASAAQPHVEGFVEKAKATLEPHIGNAAAWAESKQPGITDRVTNVIHGSSTGVPASTAPLESGNHTVATPYPAVNDPDVHAKKIGQMQNTL